MQPPRPTVLEADLAQYQATARRRQAAAEATLDRYRLRARALAEAAAELLRRDYGVTDVTLFGSLARPESPISLRSDVDLAVAGLPADRFFEAVGRLQGLDAGIAVDLLRVEDLPPHLMAVVRREGVGL